MHQRRPGHSWVLGLPALVTLLLLATGGSRAESTVPFVGAYTLIGQKADDPGLEESTTGSFDFFLAWNRGRGRLDAYVEGNTSLKENGVANLVPESNADAGTALDPDRTGRLQLSELKYGYAWTQASRLTGGLIDPSLYLDATRISNDENLQFMGAPFVNNPTIELPDYTLGFVAQLRSRLHPWRWNILLSSSHGLADNAKLSYSQLANVTDEDKGIFAGAEAAWPAKRYLVRTGAWANTSSRESLDGGGGRSASYGAYSALGGRWGSAAANIRLGLANPDVSPAAGFVSMSLQWEWDDRVLGLAAARPWPSRRSKLQGSDAGTQLEGYLRFDLPGRLYLTPSVQYLVNGDLDSSAAAVDESVIVYSLRLHHIFVRRD